jgi:predicted RNase H-like nuclease (RuvC/YqgF family)
MEQLRKANEDAENWENKARQTEAENNTLKLELITAEAEGNRLKEKVDALNREVEQVSLQKCAYSVSRVILSELGLAQHNVNQLNYINGL